MTSKTIDITASTTLPLNLLRIDDKVNVRKIGRGAESDFVASIKALGIQMPLIVRKNDTGYVVADGGKRFEAAQALVKSGDLAADAPIPVIISTASDAEARELSLALNLVRADMHPVDAYRAFSALHVDKEKPLDVDAISIRFGIDTKIVRQRLALGALDDVILTAWQKEQLREADVQAFTLLTDKKAQAALYAKLKKSGNCYSHNIRDAIKQGQRNISAMLKTVGQKAYEDRGGKVVTDLFGGEHVASDPALLQTMLEEKVVETVEKLKAEGWSFVLTERPENHFEYGRIQPPFKPTADEKTKLAKLAKIIKTTDDYEEQETAEEQKAELTDTILTRGITDKHRAASGCIVTLDQGAIAINVGWTMPAKSKGNSAAAKGGDTGAGKTKPAKKGPATLTKALSERLTEQRLTGIKTALVAHPHANPFAATLAGIVASQIHPESRYHSAPEQISKRYDAIIAGIDPKVMNVALRKAFDTKGYFEGCGKTFCLAAISEAVNADEARKVSKGKRAEIAKFAFVNVSKTGWLPKELRTPHYDGPAGKAKVRPTTTKSKTKKR